jgi:hypothetical protein
LLNKWATERASHLIKDTEKVGDCVSPGPLISRAVGFSKPPLWSCFFSSSDNPENGFCSHYPEPLILIHCLPVSKHTCLSVSNLGAPLMHMLTGAPNSGEQTQAPLCITKVHSRGSLASHCCCMSCCAGQTRALGRGKADRFMVFTGYI